MTAIDTWIAELEASRYAQLSQNLISSVDTAVAALQAIAAGLTPSGPEAKNTVYAGPISGANANPTFRVLNSADFASTLLLNIGNVSVNSATVPANGIYLSGANQLSISTNTGQKLIVTNGGQLLGANVAGFGTSGGAASNVSPTIFPNRTDSTTGIGAQAAGNISMIAGGVEIVRYVSTGIILQTGNLTLNTTVVNPFIVASTVTSATIGIIKSPVTSGQVGISYQAVNSDTTSNQWFAGVGASADNAFQLVENVGSTGTGGTTRFSLSTAGLLQLGGYGAGTATFDGSGNITSVSDPLVKEITGNFEPGLNEILATANPRYMGKHKWRKESGMDDGEYASFFAYDDFPIKWAISKNKNGVNSFSDRAVIMALVNSISELNNKIEGMKRHAN